MKNKLPLFRFYAFVSGISLIRNLIYADSAGKRIVKSGRYRCIADCNGRTIERMPKQQIDRQRHG